VAKVKPVPRKSTETNPEGPLPPLHAPPDPKPVLGFPHHADVPAAAVQSSERSKFNRSRDTAVPDPEGIVLIKTPLKNNALGRKSPLAPSPPHEATFGTLRNASGSGKYACPGAALFIRGKKNFPSTLRFQATADLFDPVDKDVSSSSMGSKTDKSIAFAEKIADGHIASFGQINNSNKKIL